MIKEKEGYLIRGKFNMSCSRSDTVLYEALNSFFGTFVENKLEDAVAQAKMRRRITRAFECGTEAAALELSPPMEAVASSPPNTSCVWNLVQSIPNLGRFLGNCFQQGGHDSTPISQGRLLQRSKFLLCKLISAIANEESPVVLSECVCVCVCRAIHGAGACVCLDISPMLDYVCCCTNHLVSISRGIYTPM